MIKLFRRQILIIIAIIDAALLMTIIFVQINRQAESIERYLTQSEIQSICELATLDCYYHNVTEWSKTGDIFSGDKKIWIEYDGSVQVGIRGKIDISEPDAENTITVTLPQASILDSDLDEDSIYEIYSEGPLWGFIPAYSKISTSESMEALNGAQNDMRTTASKNDTILNMAKERAKMIIKKNIIVLGEMAGKQYQVKFVDMTKTE